MSYDLEAVNLEKSCQEIINCVNGSSLNYSVNITPFSMYITIRKSLSRKKFQPKSHPVSDCVEASCDRLVHLEQQAESLKIELKKAEAESLSLKHEFEEALDDSESNYNENEILRAKISEYENKTEATVTQSRTKSDTIKQLKQENSELQELVQNTERESRGLKKSLSEKEKELYNLVKESKDEAQQSQIPKSKFDELINVKCVS